MFSMAVAAVRKHRITAAVALAAALIAPGAAAAAAAILRLRMMAATAILNMSGFLLRVSPT